MESVNIFCFQAHKLWVSCKIAKTLHLQLNYNYLCPGSQRKLPVTGLVRVRTNITE